LINRDILLLAIISYINDLTPLIRSQKVHWYFEEPEFFPGFLKNCVSNLENWNRTDRLIAYYNDSVIYDNDYFAEIKMKIHIDYMHFICQEKKNRTYEKNLLLLKDKNPKLYELILNQPLNDEYIMTTDIDTGFNNIFMMRENRYYYDEKNLYENIKNEIEGLNSNNMLTAMFLGLGLGYEIEAVEHKMQFTSLVILVEKKVGIFHLFLQKADLSFIYNFKHQLFYIDDPEEKIYYDILIDAGEEIRTVAVINANASRVISLSSRMIEEDSIEYYKKTVEKYNEVLKYIQGQFCYKSEQLMRDRTNVVSNFRELFKNESISSLFGKFKGKPAIVVAAGPSLEKNIHLLKRLQDKAIIITAEVVHQLLIDKGVRPHFVCVIDNADLFSAYLKKFEYEEVKDTYLVTAPVVNSSVYQAYKGPFLNVFPASYGAFFETLGAAIDVEGYNTGTNVGFACFQTAKALGCNPIILTGQDLAYNEDITQTHVAGTMGLDKQEVKKEQMQIYQNQKQIYVKGNVAEKVRTTATWERFINEYEHGVRLFDGLCINATEGGAYINGTEVMKLEEAEEKYLTEKFDTAQIIRSELSETQRKNEAEPEIRNMVSRVEKVIEDGEKISAVLHDYNQEFENIREKLEIYSQKEKYSNQENKWIDEVYYRIMNQNYIKAFINDYPESFTVWYLNAIQYQYLIYLMNINGIGNMTDKTWQHKEVAEMQLSRVFYKETGEIMEEFVKELVASKKYLLTGVNI
jgi:hypothetical protein